MTIADKDIYTYIRLVNLLDIEIQKLLLRLINIKKNKIKIKDFHICSSFYYRKK